MVALNVNGIPLLIDIEIAPAAPAPPPKSISVTCWRVNNVPLTPAGKLVPPGTNVSPKAGLETVNSIGAMASKAQIF